MLANDDVCDGMTPAEISFYFSAYATRLVRLQKSILAGGLMGNGFAKVSKEEINDMLEIL